MTGLWGFLFVPTSFVLLTVWRAYILILFWSWFVEPFALDQIGMVHAIVFVAVVGDMTRTDLPDDKNPGPLRRFAIQFGRSLGLLIFGYAVHSVSQ